MNEPTDSFHLLGFLWNVFFPINSSKNPTKRPAECAILSLCCKNQCIDSNDLCNNQALPDENMFCQTTANPPTLSMSNVCKNIPKTCIGCKYFECPGNPKPCVEDVTRPLCPNES